MRAALTVPELPEVETLRRGLAARITGRYITAAEILDRKIFDGPGDAIKHDVDGHQIGRVARRGEVLILLLGEPGSEAGESGSLLVHPKMTGQLVLTADGTTVFAGGHPPRACCGRCRTRQPGPSSGPAPRAACTTTTHGDSAGSARQGPAHAGPTRSSAGSARPAGREFHACRAAAGAGPASPRPGQGGAARPGRHRGYRQHLRRRGPVPLPRPPVPPGGRHPPE